MQEKKNKARFILLMVLTLVSVLVFWWIQPENRLDIDQERFTVEELEEISEVELKTDTSKVALTFDGAGWRVNRVYRADGDMIRVLFATLKQARPKRKVASQHKDSIYRQLEASGVRVALYAGEVLKKQFLAGGNAAKTQAYFGDPESGEVYVMIIPGYRVYVSGILELTESRWRDKFVFGFNWRNFKGLEAGFPENPSDNFNVISDRRGFGIEGLEADTAKLNTFLDEVSLLQADEFIIVPGLIDSLRHVTPRMHIRISDVGNRTYDLQLYAPQQPSRFLGVLQDSQVVSFTREKIAHLLKPKSFFRKK